MKNFPLKKLSPFLLVAIVGILGTIAIFTPSAKLHAQEPADQAVTRPDHLVYAGDLGFCNEGETEYSMLTHLGKRCGTPGNVWNTIFTLNNILADPNLVQNSTVGISAQRVCHATYSFAVDGGATPIVPASNCTLPLNAVITNVGIQATTAVTAAGSATVAVGCVGGTACGASALMAATAKASLGTAAFGQSIPVPQTASTWVKTSAAGGITLTVASGPLTAGVIELYVFYYLSSS